MDQQETPEAELARRQSRSSQLASLVKLEGWVQLVKLAEVHVTQRIVNSSYGPLGSLLEIGKKEFERGEASGIRLIMGLPVLTAVADDQRVKELLAQLGETEDAGTTTEGEPARPEDAGVRGEGL